MNDSVGACPGASGASVSPAGPRSNAYQSRCPGRSSAPARSPLYHRAARFRRRTDIRVAGQTKWTAWRPARREPANQSPTRAACFTAVASAGDAEIGVDLGVRPRGCRYGTIAHRRCVPGTQQPRVSPSKAPPVGRCRAGKRRGRRPASPWRVAASVPTSSARVMASRICRCVVRSAGTGSRSTTASSGNACGKSVAPPVRGT